MRKRYPARSRVVRQVLESVIERAGFTWEALSLTLGESANYIWYIMHGRSCSIEEFIAICLKCKADPVKELARVIGSKARN